MLLSIDDLVNLLRDSINIQYEESEIIDPVYLAMSDEDIVRYIKLGVNRIYPEVNSLEDLPNNCSQYAIILLSKIELYLKLAVTKVDKVDIGAESAYIKNSQRFDHYMKLVEETKSQYDSWLENEGNGTVQTYELLNSKYSHTKRYYENQVTPIVSIKVSNISNNGFGITWTVSMQGKFGAYLVYFSDTPILNYYAEGSSITDKVSTNAKLVKRTYDFRNSSKDISGLEPDTTYYVLVVSQCRNGVWGAKEVSVTTLSEFVEEGELEEDINGGGFFNGR